MLQHEFLPTLPSLLAQPRVPLIHRDLSWLQFNERVLAEARQATNPLLERAKFLAISATNLDEFFMIRLPALQRNIASAGRTDPESQRHLMRVRASIMEAVAKFTVKQAEALDILSSELEAEGIRIARGPQENDVAFAIGKRLFDEQVLPKLSPPELFAAAKVHFYGNVQIGAIFKNGMSFRLAKSLPAVLWAVENGVPYFFFLDDLLTSHLGPAFRLESAPGFLRLTRDGDFTVDLEEEDTESIPDVVRSGLGIREKGRPVRIQYGGDMNQETLTQTSLLLKLDPGQMLPAPNTLCLHGLWAVVNQCPESITQRPGIRYAPLKTAVPRPLRKPESIFDELKKGDLLLHHPYDAFDGFVGWIQAACADPSVEMIEQTVYRMDTLSPVIEALKAAAHRKRIRVIIELRARFDELNNLMLAEDLRKAGVEVGFGFGNLKLHAKIALVTRNEPDGQRLYTHLSTGNYNAFTARQYTDLGLMTANPEFGADARHFFDAVWKEEVPTSFKQLVSAPAKLHRRLLAHIQAETDAAKQGKKARIVAKVNALVDAAVIDHLYRASQAGVQVDLIVRGACSLIPGVSGLSENIRVISVVDRFLEHSRIYYFENSQAMYLSSADWMPRNFFSRLEIAFPILDPRLYQYLEQVIIPAYLADTVKARELTPQGTWKRRTSGGAFQKGTFIDALFGKKPVRSQFIFEELAVREYKDTPIG